MKAEIVVVGSELLSPLKQDTNSLWLVERLERLGIEVVRKSVVGDHLELLTETFRQAILRSQLVISTGGLGPTVDDLTRDAVAAASGRKLELHAEIIEHLRRRFAKRGRTMAANNERQGWIPEGAKVLENAQGTAPGLLLELERCLLVVLPGPPRELKPMFSEQVEPLLAAEAGGLCSVRRCLHVTGMGESDMDEVIAPLYSHVENPVTTINFTPTDIEIHLTARAETIEKAQALNAELALKIGQALGEKCYSLEGKLLEEVVAEDLLRLGLTVATAESLTGGLLAERLTRVPGASNYYLGSFLTYSDAMKQKLLGVPLELLERHSAVSAPVAEAMARGARERTGADLALATTGFAGPDGGTEKDPVGTVYVGLAGPDRVESRRFMLLGDRQLIRLRATQAALYLLRKRFLLPAAKA